MATPMPAGTRPIPPASHKVPHNVAVMKKMTAATCPQRYRLAVTSRCTERMQDIFANTSGCLVMSHLHYPFNAVHRGDAMACWRFCGLGTCSAAVWPCLCCQGALMLARSCGWSIVCASMSSQACGFVWITSTSVLVKLSGSSIPGRV